MKKERLWDRMRYTAVGLVRLGAEAVRTFSERAYRAGRGEPPPEAPSATSADDRE